MVFLLLRVPRSIFWARASVPPPPQTPGDALPPSMGHRGTSGPRVILTWGTPAGADPEHPDSSVQKEPGKVTGGCGQSPASHSPTLGSHLQSAPQGVRWDLLMPEGDLLSLVTSVSTEYLPFCLLT